MTDLRKDKRAPASLKVKYKSGTVDEFVEQFGTDVSVGGVFIRRRSRSRPASCSSSSCS